MARPTPGLFLLSAALVAAPSCRRPPPPPSAIRIAQFSSAVTLDPYRHDSYYTFTTLSHFYESLVRLGPDLQLLPALAASWENPGETLWRLHLRRNVVFHDGRAFGATDVVESLKRAREPDAASRDYLEGVEDVRAVDEHTVEIRTKEPNAPFLNSLYFIHIVPRGTPAAPITTPVGTGPYRFVSGRPEGTISGERFEKYWGERPAFDKVTVLQVPDAVARAEAIARGEADVIVQFPPERWAAAQKDPRLELASRIGTAVEFLFFSLRPGQPFADVRIRSAIARAIDRPAIVKNALFGQGVPADEIVAPNVAGYAREIAHRPRDLAEARRLLAEAHRARGFEATLFVGKRFEAIAREVARQLAEIGIRLKLDVVSYNVFHERTLHEEIPLALHSYGSDTGDAANTLGTFLHAPGKGFGQFNKGGYRNAELDETIERASLATLPTQRLALLARALEIVEKDVPIVPLTIRSDLYAFRADLDYVPRADRLRAMDVRPRAQ